MTVFHQTSSKPVMMDLLIIPAFRKDLKDSAIRSSHFRYLERDLLRCLLWLGPITIPGRHNSPGLCSNVVDAGHGFGVSLVAASHYHQPFRLELGIFLKMTWRGPGVSFSIDWNLSWPCIIPWDADVVDHALHGDVNAMKKRFSARLSSPFDQLPDGSTLLHVRF